MLYTYNIHIYYTHMLYTYDINTSSGDLSKHKAVNPTISEKNIDADSNDSVMASLLLNFRIDDTVGGKIVFKM